MEPDDLDNEIDGLILRIEVSNFLCHDNLVVDFQHGNVHWVYGRNGSGKSAIVTALVVGLGGNASATRRGHNIQSFIKKGTNSAEIKIKIKNSTNKSYNKEIYGDHITVVRKITTSGGSSYMVKAATGITHGRTHAEISNIMSALDIQVDNPISVLNQDDARTFAMMKPKKMFSLFRRATNLDSSEANYKVVLENCNAAIAIKNEKEKTCAQLEREFKNWQKKHSQLLSSVDIERQIHSLENEIVWSELAELESNLRTLNEQIQQDMKKTESMTGKIERLQKSLRIHHTTIDTLKQNLEETDREQLTLEADKKNAETKKLEAIAQYNSAQLATDRKQKQLDNETKKIGDFEHEIANIE